MTSKIKTQEFLLKGKLLKDVNRYADSMEMEIEEAINHLLKGALKRDKEVLRKEEQEVFQLMLDDNIHPDLHYMFSNIDEIMDYINHD